MLIESMRLTDFRNFTLQEMEFSRGLNIFCGDNAQGKTNLLEAISLCSTGRSFRGAKDRDMIRLGCEEAHIRLSGQKKEIPYRIDLHLRRSAAKGIAVNSVPIRRTAELIGLLHVVFFSPDDLQLVKSGPAERRRFIDMELCSLDAGYLKDLTLYHRCLEQRNALLKTIGPNDRIPDTLDVWDGQLVQTGEKIIRARRKFIGELSPVVREIHAKISGGREDLSVSYEPDTEEDTLAARLSENRSRDLKFRATSAGPHRDDLRFGVKPAGDGKNPRIDLRTFGSQGQQRTAALSAKMAEIEMIRRRTGEPPVLLLDDVLSELDAGRQKSLLSEISDTQTMITCTGLDELVRSRLHIDRIFRVRTGSAQEVSSMESASAETEETDE